MYIYIFIYLFIGRERERERENMWLITGILGFKGHEPFLFDSFWLCWFLLLKGRILQEMWQLPQSSTMIFRRPLESPRDTLCDILTFHPKGPKYSDMEHVCSCLGLVTIALGGYLLVGHLDP